MSIEMQILAAKVMRNAGIDARENRNNDLPIHTTPHGINRYPLKKMGKGQHFFVPYRGKTKQQLQNSLTSCMCNATQKTGHRFTQQSGALGVRVWRIS